MKLQGKGFLAYELLVEITPFQVKLALFSEQLSEQNFSHFFITVQLRELSKLWRDITNRCNVKASVFIGFGCAGELSSCTACLILSDRTEQRC